MIKFTYNHTNVPGETETYLQAKPPKPGESSFAIVINSETYETSETSETGETSETSKTSEMAKSPKLAKLLKPKKRN